MPLDDSKKENKTKLKDLRKTLLDNDNRLQQFTACLNNKVEEVKGITSAGTNAAVVWNKIEEKSKEWRDSVKSSNSSKIQETKSAEVIPEK